MRQIVTGVFDHVTNAENAVRALLDANFPDDKIGVVTHNSELGAVIADDLGREYAGGSTPPRDEVTNPSTVYDRLPEGFSTALSKSNLPPDAVNWYRSRLDQHHLLVIVDAGDRAGDAMRMLREHGAMMYQPTGQAMTEQRMTRETGAPTEVHVPVIEEEVSIEKTTHQVGEVSVTSENTTRTVEIPTTVMHQEIRVERTKLDHPMHPDEYKGSTTQEGVIRMPIIEEEVRVVKEPIIREELVITRVPVTERETIRETVMHAEPQVETTGEVEMEKREEKRRPAA